MERTHFVKLSVNPILPLEDLGLDRRASLDDASRGLAQVSEAQIVRSVQFPAGALFFMLVPEDPESGGVYVFDRSSGVFYWLNFEDGKWGGYSIAEFEELSRGLSAHRARTASGDASKTLCATRTGELKGLLVCEPCRFRGAVTVPRHRARPLVMLFHQLVHAAQCAGS